MTKRYYVTRNSTFPRPWLVRDAKSGLILSTFATSADAYKEAAMLNEGWDKFSAYIEGQR